ncbi:MAG: hypothetical protein IKG84_04280, partial [Bacteroidales bacterium]|nr:hypothetical protein [Bacteroidales bacterium]
PQSPIPNPHVVNQLYRAPELLLGYIYYDEKIDIFSVGCILLELFNLSPIFCGSIEGMQLIEYFSILGIPNKEYFKQIGVPKDFIKYFTSLQFKKQNLKSLINKHGFYGEKDIEEAEDLIKNMLEYDIGKRFGVTQCLNHEFLKNVDLDEHLEDKDE